MSDELAARVQADHLMTQKIELGLRCGQILGPEYDGVPFEDVCRELVQLRAAAARVHALVDKLYRTGTGVALCWRVCVLCRGMATWPIHDLDRRVKVHAGECPVAELEAVLAQEKP